MLFVLSNAAYAFTPTEATLKGVYQFQFSQTGLDVWSNTISLTCFGKKYTVTAGGQTVATSVTYGTFTFNGAGAVSAAYTESGQFDQAASDSTVSVACSSNPDSPYVVNVGHAVFSGGTEGAGTGTYTVHANPGGAGDGGAISIGSGVPIDFALTGLNNSNIAGTLLLRQMKNSGNASLGIAVLE
jgi:hypothetical protein